MPFSEVRETTVRRFEEETESVLEAISTGSRVQVSKLSFFHLLVVYAVWVKGSRQV